MKVSLDKLLLINLTNIENKGEFSRIAEPYRIFNADHFDDRYPNMSLYGSSPLLYSIETTTSTGLIMLTSWDSLVDMIRQQDRAKFEWTNETGVIDLYVISCILKFLIINLAIQLWWLWA